MRQPLLKDKQTTRVLLKFLLCRTPFALRFSVKVINVTQSSKVLSDTAFTLRTDRIVLLIELYLSCPDLTH